jgi:hypothetical protein
MCCVWRGNSCFADRSVATCVVVWQSITIQAWTQKVPNKIDCAYPQSDLPTSSTASNYCIPDQWRWYVMAVLYRDSDSESDSYSNSDIHTDWRQINWGWYIAFSAWLPLPKESFLPFIDSTFSNHYDREYQLKLSQYNSLSVCLSHFPNIWVKLNHWPTPFSQK